jgi:alginate O-acetyltransferase complex protein AlgJ
LLFAIFTAVVCLVAKPRHIVNMPMPVVAGCPGWLFLSSELAASPHRDAYFPAHIRFIEKIAAYLTSQRVPLVVVPVPDKSRVQAEALCRLRRANAIEDRLERMTGSLRGAGIKVIDLLRPLRELGEDAFYRTDSHWNERGAKRAAEIIAAELRQWGLDSSERAEFRFTSEPPRERIGDLIGLVGLEHAPSAFRPAGDIEAPTAIEQRAPPGVGLLDELPAPDIVMFGTSFSVTGNFVKFLAASLGAPIDNRALRGGGLTKAAQAYFADLIFLRARPRVVIWEIPEHMEYRVEKAETEWDPGSGARKLP